jgi:hypothetical protein
VWPIRIADSAGFLKRHSAEGGGLLRPPERVGSTGKNFKLLMQVSQNVRLGVLSGHVARKSTYGKSAGLCALDSIMLKQVDAETCQGIRSFDYVVGMRLILLGEETGHP